MKLNRYIAALIFATGLANAHEGHNEAPKSSIKTEAAPRAEAQTDLFELVAMPGNGQLTIYLDRFASNEPVVGAKVEVESGTWKAVAITAGDGIYRVNAPLFAKPGSYPLLFTVQAGADADLLETTVLVSAAVGTDKDNDAHPAVAGWMWWSGSAALLALGVGLLRFRYTRPGQPSPRDQSKDKPEK